MYADDLVFYTSNKKPQSVKARLQEDIDSVFNWCQRKRLTVNVNKTKVCWSVSSQKKGRIAGINFDMGGKRLGTVDHYKYLGLSIDSGLTMEQAYKDVSQKVNSRLFGFSKLRVNMTQSTAIRVYKSMILSLFDYACFAYEGATKDNLKKLQRLQNRGLSICFRNGKGGHITVENLHLLSGVPKLERRRQELLLSLMYKYSNEDRWVDMAPRGRVTRSQKKIKFSLLRHNSALYTRSPIYRGSTLWDNLGDWFQTSDSKMQFKKRIALCEDLSVKNKNPPLTLSRDESLLVEDISSDDDSIV